MRRSLARLNAQLANELHKPCRPAQQKTCPENAVP
jgi:hypothetical protein